MKNTLRMAVVVSVLVINFFFGITAWAQEGQLILKEELVRYVKPVKSLSGFAPASVHPSLPHLQMMHERVEISSLCSVNSSSSNLAASRRNVMGGLVGMMVNTNLADPAGWYVVPTNGWQWHHVIASTTLPLWRGFTNSLIVGMQGERRGNRMVIHAMGRYPVSNYQCQVSTSITNFPSETTFWVGKDTGTGSNLMFNANFVGIHFGPNGIVESTYNSETGIWTQRGDDIVYSNGENPDAVQYTVWVRFGATVSITANSTLGIKTVKNQFAMRPQTFAVSLLNNGQTVSEKILTSEMPRLALEEVGETNSMVRLSLPWGQDDVRYEVLATFSLNSDWVTGPGNSVSKNWIEQHPVDFVKLPGGVFYKVRALPD